MYSIVKVMACCLYRCGCFCCKRICRQWILTETVGEVDSEEREQLQEPVDEISLSSADSIELEGDENDHRTTETLV